MIFHDIGLDQEIHESNFAIFVMCPLLFIGILLKWKFLRRQTREICENKTHAQYTAYTVFVYYDLSWKYNGGWDLQFER